MENKWRAGVRVLGCAGILACLVLFVFTVDKPGGELQTLDSNWCLVAGTIMWSGSLISLALSLLSRTARENE